MSILFDDKAKAFVLKWLWPVGRLSRREGLWLLAASVAAELLYFLFVIAVFLGDKVPLASDGPSWLSSGVSLVIALCSGWLALVLLAKRLQDADRAIWPAICIALLSFLLSLPDSETAAGLNGLLTIAAIIWAISLKGTVGPNRYGIDRRASMEPSVPPPVGPWTPAATPARQPITSFSALWARVSENYRQSQATIKTGPWYLQPSLGIAVAGIILVGYKQYQRHHNGTLTPTNPVRAATPASSPIQKPKPDLLAQCRDADTLATVKEIFEEQRDSHGTPLHVLKIYDVKRLPLPQRVKS